MSHHNILQDKDGKEDIGQRWMSFGGIRAAQILSDYYLWESILNDTPKAKSIVELGTFEGGFSLYLAAQARARGLTFRTYDIISPARDIPGFIQLDIFAEKEAIGQYLVQNHPFILFCDGGNKARELRIFSQYLCPDSIILVHDWMEEIFPEDIPDNIQMIYEEYCESLSSKTRIFNAKTR